MAKKKTKGDLALLGFARRVRMPNRRVKIIPRWWLIGTTLLALALLTFIGQGVVHYYVFKYKREFEETTFVDMLFYRFNPELRSSFQKKLGNYYVDKAFEELRRTDQRPNFSEVLFFARQGVTRSPDNLDGVLLIAQFFEPERPERAARILRETLKYALEEEDEDKRLSYIRAMSTLHLKHSFDYELIDLVREVLDGREERTKTNRLLAIAAAQASFFRGHYDQAEEFIAGYDLTTTIDGIMLSARISWDRGQQALAIDKLKSFIRKYPEEDRLYMLLTQFYRDAGDLDRARTNAVMRMANNPTSPGPRIEFLYVLNELNEDARMERELESFIEQFSNDEAALARLANLATDTGRFDLALRLYEIALERDYSIETFALLLIETAVVADRFDEAIAFAEEVENEDPDWLQRSKTVFESLRSVAYFGAGNDELGNHYLNRFLNSSSVRNATLLAVARRFERLGEIGVARDILANAYERDPNNQLVLARLVDIEMTLGNNFAISNLLRQLLTMRRPPLDLIERAYTNLGSDRFIFARDREELLIELAAVLRENRGGLPDRLEAARIAADASTSG